MTIQLASSANRPIAVRFEDELPDDTRLIGAEPSTRSTWGALEGGWIDGIVTLAPKATETLTYLLAGRASKTIHDNDLPAPQVVSLLGVSPDCPTDPVVRWLSSQGERVPLVARMLADHPDSLDTNAIDGYLLEPAINPDSETTAHAIDVPRDPLNAPAVGIIARVEDTDAIYRTLLEARRHGFRVFLVPFGPKTEEIAEVVRDLDVAVVEPPPNASWMEARGALSSAVRAAGHPGLVLQPEGCPPIDYPQTLEAFAAGGYEMYAIARQPEMTADRPHVLVGVPAYNAAGTIADVVCEASAFADEVLVVDDGSADGTADRARDAGATVVVHERNRGYGGALKTIFDEAHDRGTAHLVTIDADGQHDPGEIPRLVATQEETGAEVVIASRYVAGARTEIPFVRSLGLSVVNALTNLSIGRIRPSRWVRDTQSGFRAYTSPAIASISDGWDIGDGMWASTDILYQASVEGFDFHEIGTAITYDVDHGSTESALTHGTGLVHNIGGILQRSHPIVLLALPGLTAVVAGIVLLLWTLRLPIDGVLFAVAIVAAAAVAIGGVMVALAIVFHVLNTHPSFARDG